jgi:hypothetical protein
LSNTTGYPLRVVVVGGGDGGGSGGGGGGDDGGGGGGGGIGDYDELSIHSTIGPYSFHHQLHVILATAASFKN